MAVKIASSPLVFQLSNSHFPPEVWAEVIEDTLRGNSIDYTDARDVLFLSEIPKMQSCYHLNSVELYTLVCDGISNLLVGDEDIDAGTAELAEMVRTCLKIRKVRQNVLNMYPDVGRTEILNSPLSAG